MIDEVDVRAADGRVLHAYVTAAGADGDLPVLWNHGTPNIGTPPKPLFDAARERGLRWFGYDRPGYGGSNPHPGGTVADAADDARAVADHLRFARFGVFGHSGGGPRALACAALLPGRVLAAVAVSPPAPWPADGLDYFAGMAPGAVGELRAAVRGREALEHVLATDEFDPTSFIPADDEALAGTWSWFDGVVAAATANGMGGMVDDDLAAMEPWGFDARDITVPTLIVHGTGDRMVPSSHGSWLADRIPFGELRLVPEAGHISVLQVAPEALSWLRDHAR